MSTELQTSVLHGRELELDLLGGLVSRTDGRGGALIVHGDAGIGKSALLASAAATARAQGALVLRAAGIQAEAHFPLAGLHQLLRPVLGSADVLPPQQRDALLAGFGTADAHAPDFFLIALATLDLLSAVARDAPALLVVEDAQWFDEPTLDVLAFISRRLESEPITLLAAVRDGYGNALLDVGLPELKLAPLADDAAEALLAACAPDLTPETHRRLLDEAAGNPLALSQLPAALAPVAPGDDAALPAVLPLTPRLEEAFSARSRQLPPGAQTSLLVAAVADAASPADVLRAARVLDAGASSGDLDLAISAGLVDVEEAAVRFKHPLVRAAILQSAGGARRRGAQNALEGALQSGPEQAAWQRAAAAVALDNHVDPESSRAAAQAQKANALPASALGRAPTGGKNAGKRENRPLEPTELAFDGSWHDTIEEKVYGELRELIVSLQLQPGTRLTQRGVADRLGVSQTPVRAAMGRLSREGLVTRKHGRATVTALTRELYQELLAARLGPEALIARLGAPLVTDDDLAKMDATLEDLHSFADRRNSRSYVKSRWQLHSICYQAANRPRLLAEVERLFSLGERYSVALPAVPEVMNQSVQFYRDFVSACHARDANTAERTIIKGVEWGWTTLAHYFPSEEDARPHES